MGLKNWLAADATELGAQDRIAEKNKGKPLSTKWSLRTIANYAFCRDHVDFSNTYRLGSEQQAQAIRNAREYFTSLADTTRLGSEQQTRALRNVNEYKNVLDRENVMSEANSLRYQADCWRIFAEKFTNFKKNNDDNYKNFEDVVDAMKGKGLLADFHDFLLVFKLNGYGPQATSLSSLLQKHIDDFVMLANYYKQLADEAENGGPPKKP
ncbi:MAG: hypothetical protein ACYC4A_05865 [Desulfobulbia bacterium]